MATGVTLGVVPPASAGGREVVFVCDDRGVVLDSSSTIEAIFGRSPESVRGAPLSLLASPGDEGLVEGGLAEARERGMASFSARWQLRDGQEHGVNVSAWRLSAHGSALTICMVGDGDVAGRQAEERARRLADTQKVIATILELALEDIPLDELLRRTLDLILWIPWLSIEKTGAIFLVEHEPRELVLKVHRGLRTSLLTSCARVAFGTCLCGRAAASGAPVHAAALDDRHTTRYPGIAPHGHYCVPIGSGDVTLGVITTYLAPGHEASAIDLEFLIAVADTLAGVLMRRRADAERQSLRLRVAETSVLAHELEVVRIAAQLLVQQLRTGDPLRTTAEAMERATQRAVSLLNKRSGTTERDDGGTEPGTGDHERS